MLTVFGSINLDISVTAPHLARAGETVLGGAARFAAGGKGANQAHAARLFGAQVALAGSVGDDAFAAPALACLRQAGVDLARVATLPGSATGLALITLDAQGDNAIIVAPGANDHADPHAVDDALLARTRILLLQLEVPLAASMAVARRAHAAGARVILNAAPMLLETMPDWDALDILAVNEEEAAHLAGKLGIATPDAATRAAGLAEATGCSILLTLGGAGALLAEPGGALHRAPALPVKVVDTTGAGDTFIGVFGAALCAGLDYPAALAHAGAAAGLACTRRGAQVAQPARAEIDRAWHT